MKYIRVACWLSQCYSKIPCGISLFQKYLPSSWSCHVQTTPVFSASSHCAQQIAKPPLWLVQQHMSFKLSKGVRQRVEEKKNKTAKGEKKKETHSQEA